MFRLKGKLVGFEKSQRKGYLTIKGIASGVAVDIEGDRFSEKAVQSMEKSVNDGGIPIRVEHMDMFYSNIGYWTKAEYNKSTGEVEVTGEIDLAYSLAKDAEISLRRGEPIALSVGGKLKGVTSEYDAEKSMHVNVFEDVALSEISLTKNPAYTASTLSISKSVNRDALKKGVIEPSAKAKEIAKQAKGPVKVAPDNLATKVMVKLIEKHIINGEAIENAETLISDGEQVMKSYYDECCEESRAMTMDDFRAIMSIICVMKELEVNHVKEPARFKEDGWWDYKYDNFEDIHYILDSKMNRVFLYRNEDGTINEEWLRYGLYKLVKPSCYYKPKELLFILKQILHAFVLLEQQAKLNNDDNPDNDVQLSQDLNSALDFSKSCFLFAKGFSPKRPQINGADLSNDQVQETAQAYVAFMKRRASELRNPGLDVESIQKSLDKFLNSPNMTVEKTADTAAAQAAPETTAAVEAAGTVDTTPETTEAVTATETETPTTETTEVEAPAEDPAPTVEKTEGEAAETAAPEAATETETETPVVEEAPESGGEGGEATTETVETPPSVTSIDTEAVTKAILAGLTTNLQPMVEAEVAKAVAPLLESQEVAKSATVEKSNQVEKSLTDFQKSVTNDVQKNATTLTNLQKSLGELTEAVHTIAKTAAPRKAFATAHVFKTVTRAEADSVAKSKGEVIDSFIEKGMSTQEAYAAYLQGER